MAEDTEALEGEEEELAEEQQELKFERQPTLREEGLFVLCQWCAAQVMASRYFAIAVAAAIFLNVAEMTLQVDYPNFPHGADCAGECTDFWDALDSIFLTFFTLELCVRFAALGCSGFFCKKSDERSWNLFDFCVVATCWCLVAVQDASEGGKFVQLLRSLRILRMLRLLRIFHLPYLRKLNVIVAGLMKSFAVVFWIAALLGLFMFVSAIFCTDLLGHAASDWGEDAGEIELYFGTMWSSWRTLFQFLTLADWSAITRLVGRERCLMYFFFVAYVVFAAMVILSLLTGVLADHMNSVREAEEAEEKRELQRLRAAAVRAEFRAFKQADGTGKHLVGREEFRQVLRTPGVIQQLEDVGVSVGSYEPDELFECFDSRSSGKITWHEFKTGMEELRCGVTPKQVFKLEVSLRRSVKGRPGCGEAETAADISRKLAPRPLSFEVENKLESMESRVESLETLLGGLDKALQALDDLESDEAL